MVGTKMNGNRIQASALALAIVAGCSFAAPAFADAGFGFDSDHDVIVLADSDVALRYNNKTFVPVKAVLLDASAPAILKVPPIKSIRIYEDLASAGLKTAPEQIVIQAYEVGKIGAFGASRFSKEFMDDNRVREVQLTRDRVSKETGLAASSYVGITSVKSYEIAPKSGASPYYLHVFQTPERLTLYARRMRNDVDSRSSDFDAVNIVTQLRVRNTGDCSGNVILDAAPKQAAAAETKQATADTKQAAADK
jgi:hypothetical protein